MPLNDPDPNFAHDFDKELAAIDGVPYEYSGVEWPVPKVEEKFLRLVELAGKPCPHCAWIVSSVHHWGYMECDKCHKLWL